MDILTIIAVALFIGMIAAWVILPGSSRVLAATPEGEATTLLPAQQSA